MNRTSMLEIINRIRTKKPLVHLLTNSVVENVSVNALLALGATAVCTHDAQDTHEAASKTDGLLINMGTFDERFIDCLSYAQSTTRERHMPIVLDPVGCGFTASRMTVVQSIIERGGISLIKGNYAEISALATSSCEQRGVDGAQSNLSSVQLSSMSNHLGCAVIATGATDMVCSAAQLSTFNCGHPLMSSVIGMGCIAGAIATAALSVESDIFSASCFAVLANGIAGEVAAKHAHAPGSFQSAFIDALYLLPQHVEKYAF